MAATKPDAMLWHQRLGHMGCSLLKPTQKHSTGMENIPFESTIAYEACYIAKSQPIISREETDRATTPFGRLHIDVFGHITPESV
jgi:hypothetical protein